MKYLFCLFSMFVFAEGCNDKSSKNETIKDAQDDVSITYEAYSRGFYEKIELNKKEIVIPKDRNENVVLRKNCSSKDWNEVIALLDKIDAEKLKKNYVNADDVGRDAVIPATLSIKYKDNMVKSVSLAHGNPPETLAPLIAKLQAMALAVENQ